MAKGKTEEIAAVPRHLAIIMDGNGRWAKRRAMPRSYGHKRGVAAVERTVGYCLRYGVKVLSVYAFSTENWSRPENEVAQLLTMIREYFADSRKRFLESGVRVRVMGTRVGLDAETAAAIDAIERDTAGGEALTFNIGFNYGAREEILHAVNTLLAAGKRDVTEQDFAACLYTAGLPDPDLVIRTSGEQRLSNFMLYQLAYAELYFTDRFWPDFDEEEFCKALASYGRRSRRFGGL